MVDLEIMDLFNELEKLIDDAPQKAFSHKISLDKDEVLRVINEIKTAIPEEVKQAVWVNTERQKIIKEAKRQAEEIIAQGEKEANRILEENKKNMEALDREYEQKIQTMIENNEVVKRANERAEEIKDKAENYKMEMIDRSNQYAEDVLSFVEQKLQETLEEVKENKRQLNPRL